MEYVIDDSVFQHSERAVVKDYGDKFNGWWGFETIELSKEDLTALMDGKILESCCAGEYGVLIRLERDEDND